jgi:hypothetical protein
LCYLWSPVGEVVETQGFAVLKFKDDFCRFKRLSTFGLGGLHRQGILLPLALRQETV